MAKCPADSDLHRYHAKEMSEAEAIGVRAHLEQCTACAQRDAELLAKQEAMVKQLRGADLGEVKPNVDIGATQPVGTTLGSSMPTVQIEGYDIIRELQRGGQGVVYLAVQRGTKRKVAIKVLLEGPYASASSKKRFEREIELVAQLKHPNITAIFHSGLTQDGHHYCAMDYIRGVPLNHYVHDSKPTLEEALALFCKVCDAVNYAHQKGVIHRDLKPSNILVDADGEPKLLDFGLAKMVSGAVQTLVSVTGQVVGTLPYMSPEQTRGNPDEIDIRTDVYALGVMFYEALTGRYPYPVVGEMADVLKNIAETEPTPPSRQWTSDSGITKSATKRRRAGQCPIDDDLQTIILKTLSKQRDRRYQSAGELGRDIGHYLADEPIEAKRDSGWYVLKKSLRRHRVPVAIVAVFVMLISVSAGSFGFLYNRAVVARRAEADQRQEALRQAKIAQAVTGFLNNDLFASVHPDKASSREVTVREILDVASQKIERQFDDQPAVEAQLRQTIGHVYYALGRHHDAQEHLERALTLRLELFGEDSLEVAETQDSLALVYCFGAGDKAKAVDLAAKVLFIREQKLGQKHALTLRSLGDLAMFKALERGESAAGLDELMLKIMVTVRGKGETLDQLREYIEETLMWGQRLWASGEHDAVVAQYLSDVEPFLSTPILAERVPLVLAAFALRMLDQDRVILAESVAASAMQLGKTRFGEEHPDTIYASEILGRTYWAQGRYEEAEQLFIKAIKLRREVQGPAHPQRLGIMRTVARLYSRQSWYGKAEAKLVEANELINSDASATREQTPRLTQDFIDLYVAWGKPEQAAEWRTKLQQAEADASPD